MSKTTEQLERLADLRDRGVLTQEEFDDQKARLLGSPNANATPRPSIAADNVPGDDEQRKQATRNRWAKIAGIVVTLLALLRVGLYFLPSAPKACDASETTSAVLDAMNDRYKADNKTFTLTGLSNIVTTSSGDKMNQCKALGTFSDKATASVVYNVTGDSVEASVTPDAPPAP